MHGLHGKIQQRHPHQHGQQRAFDKRRRQPGQGQQRQGNARRALTVPLIGQASGSRCSQGAGNTGKTEQADLGMRQRQWRRTQWQHHGCPQHTEGGENE
ncbi:hypothetical protein D3C77_239040 [compost metagenome]